ncbi:MAG TPA: hypothetical protein VF941_01930 [Clostridia bacterium]
MGRTLNDLVVRICTELDENPGDSTVTGSIKKFINTIYKDVAIKEKLERRVTISASNGIISKPSDFYDVSDIFYNDCSMEFEERGSDIYVFLPAFDITNDTACDVDMLYFYIPPDLGDTDTPLTNQANDDLIVAGAKYIYLQSDNQYSKAEVHNRDYNILPVRRMRKSMEWKVVR